MIKKEHAFLSADGKTEIAYTLWIPDGQPKAILQIAHGMVEFIDRYDRFASVLAEQGWLVVGNDHLGHGRSVVNEAALGYFARPHGEEVVITDMHTLRTRISADYPTLPYFLLGHSMGSFMTRAYIQEHGNGLAGAIIMGTGSQPAFLPYVARCLCGCIALFKGWKHRSAFIDSLAFSGNNKAFEPARTPRDWLTRDEAIVDAYNAHPWNNYRFTLNGFDGLFRAITKAQSKTRIAMIPKDLPLLVISGGSDPVGGTGAGVKQAYDALKAAGIRDVELKLYPEARHEILNEINRDEVDADILAWLGRHMQGGKNA